MRYGSTAQKIVLLLLGGVALGFSGSPTRYGRILKNIAHEWRSIERRNLNRAIRSLYEAKAVDYREHDDGTVSIVLTREGKKIALRYSLDEMKIRPPERWDKKWRIVLFDIPEEHKTLRDAIRIQLRRLGLRELQKSVFVHPYECQNEIEFIIETFDARRYVRFVEATRIDNELHFKKMFRLL